MSAIYGAIDLSGNKISSDLSSKFKNYYSDFKIDKLEDLSLNNAVMGCGIQFFNNESKEEILPIYDEENGYLFTADCVLDNREELCMKLQLPKNTPDGRILYESFLKWNTKCFDYLRGVFSFVLYDIKNNTVVLAVDHFAQRCLFYHRNKNTIYFSTLFFPIIKNLDLSFEENERWIADCITMQAPVMMSEPKETAMLGVYKVVSGTYVTFDLSKESETETRYYDPVKKIKTNSSITLEQSEKMIRDNLEKVIKRIIRPDICIGTQLSQGLDSSSVACVAAKELAKEVRTLKSYTSIPRDDANLISKGPSVYDESAGVNIIVEKYPNISPTFLDTKDRNYLLEIDSLNNIWELPTKSQQNAVWTDEIARVAAMDGCKIILTGATGNCTISAGYTENTFIHYMKRFQIHKAIKALDVLKKGNISRKKFVDNIFISWKNYYKWYFNKDNKNYCKNTLVNPELAKKYKINERFNKNYYHIYPLADIKKLRECMYMPNANAQIGEIDTKYGLKYGLLFRDPMRSVEIVEMCLSLPMKCYAWSDYDRRLVRAGMKDIVPPEILNDIFRRGRQSGDNHYRMSLVWEEILPDIKATMTSKETCKYINQDKLIADLELLSDKNFTDKNFTDKNFSKHFSETFSLVNSYSICKYLLQLYRK